jgi:hypothetical protein
MAKSFSIIRHDSTKREEKQKQSMDPKCRQTFPNGCVSLLLFWQLLMGGNCKRIPAQWENTEERVSSTPTVGCPELLSELLLRLI